MPGSIRRTLSASTRLAPVGLRFTNCGITGCSISSLLKEIWPFILCLVLALLLTFCPILIDIVSNLIYGPVGAGGV